MTQFEFLFFLYAFILGLAVVELLSGFGASLERAFANTRGERQFRIGWLTPLFAVFVLLDLITFWLFAWIVRDDIELTARSVLGVLTFASAYYLAARLVFPSDPEDFVDLDTHYFRVKKTVFGMMIGLALAQLTFIATIPELFAAMTEPMSLVFLTIFIALMLAAAFVRSSRLSTLLLVALIARHTFFYVF